MAARTVVGVILTFTTLERIQRAANLENALVHSDNIYFAKAALKIGGNRFANMLKQFRIWRDHPLELDMAASQISESGGFDSDAQLAASGFGQGQLLVNPLHMPSLFVFF